MQVERILNDPWGARVKTDATLRHKHDGPNWLNWLIDFPNGWTISVRQFGPGSYSDADSVELFAYRNSTSERWDDVQGWQGVDGLHSAIMEVSRY